MEPRNDNIPLHLYPNLQDTELEDVSLGKNDSLDRAPDPNTGNSLYPNIVTPSKESVHQLGNVGVHTDPANVSVSTTGVIFNAGLYVSDIVFDFLLALTLYNQAQKETPGSAAAWETHVWFIVTLVIIVVPMGLINIFSLFWYFQNKQCLGDYCVMNRSSCVRKTYIAFMHCLFLAPFVRYFDMLYYKYLMQKEKKTVNVVHHQENIKVTRLSPRGETYAVLLMVICRDTAMLDMLHAFLQDSPQLILQIFLLYRSPTIITANPNSFRTITIQTVKIILGLFSLAIALVSYQEELRRGHIEKPKLGVVGSFLCLLWRMSMIASRIITISTFGAIVKGGEPKETGSGWYGYTNTADPRDPFTFPAIAAYVFVAHWIAMTIWIHCQKANFCASPVDGHPRHCQEFFYSCVMGWVHIFCFINHKETPARRRMFFFYLLTFIENTVLISVWYWQAVVVTDLWFRIGVVSIVQLLFIFGLSNLLIYFGFLHVTHGGQVSPFVR